VAFLDEQFICRRKSFGEWGRISGARNKFESKGAHVRRNFFCRVPPLYWLYTHYSSFERTLCGGQYSLVIFLSAILPLAVPPWPAICKSRGDVPSVPYGVGAPGWDDTGGLCPLPHSPRRQPKTAPVHLYVSDCDGESGSVFLCFLCVFCFRFGAFCRLLINGDGT